MKETALAYLRNGLCVLPALKKEKRPALRQWKDYQFRLPTHSEWQGWFADTLCIVCGAVSGNLLMFDFDQQGKVFEAFKSRCPKELFDRLVIETSQSGGKHIIFRTESLVGTSERLAIDADKKVLIETRGEKALFLCAPTPGYELIQGDFQNIPVLTDDEGTFLFELARGFNEYQEPLSPLPPPPAKRFTPVQTSGKRPGDVLHESGAGFIREILQKHGWTFVRQRNEHEEIWRRPGKTFGESAIFHTDTPTLHVFSTDAAPFTATTYSYFRVYAMLEHGNDYSAAAKAFASLFDHLNVIAAHPVANVTAAQNPPSNIDVGMPLNSLLVSLAQEAQTSAP